MGLGRGMYQYVKKANLGGGHSITEQPLAQQQQAQVWVYTGCLLSLAVTGVA